MCVNAPPFSTIFKKTLKVPIDNFKILDYSQGITHRLLNHPVIDSFFNKDLHFISIILFIFQKKGPGQGF